MNALLKRDGFTLIEAMVALLVFSVGVLALFGMQNVVVNANAFGRDMSRAVDFARDLAENMQTWAYTDARLGSSRALGDTAGLETIDLAKDPLTAPADADHLDADLGGGYTGIRESTLVPGNAPRYQRFWNVVGLDMNGDAIEDGKMVAVIVRWREPNRNQGAFRRVVVLTTVDNPAN